MNLNTENTTLKNLQMDINSNLWKLISAYSEVSAIGNKANKFERKVSFPSR